MLSSQHVFSHQHAYPGSDWQQAQHSRHGHPQGQMNAAQQQHYGRMPAGPTTGTDYGSGNGSGEGRIATNGQSQGEGLGNEEHRRVLEQIAQMMRPDTRESALLELSKKREQVPELALILWHSFGVMVSLLQEIISVYPLLNPSQLTAAASNRVCNALALLQCVASHSETRGLFLGGESSITSLLSSADRLHSSYSALPLPIPQHNFQEQTIRVSPAHFSRCHWRLGQERLERSDQFPTHYRNHPPLPAHHGDGLRAQ